MLRFCASFAGFSDQESKSSRPPIEKESPRRSWERMLRKEKTVFDEPITWTENPVYEAFPAVTGGGKALPRDAIGMKPVSVGGSYGKFNGNDSALVRSGRIPGASSGRPSDFFRDTPFYNVSPVYFDSDSSGDTHYSIREEKRREDSFAGAEENIVIRGRLIDFNDTEEGFFLGYSNNVFDTHTKYIKNKKGDFEYYSPEDAAGRGRRKRSVLHLYNMVLCATGCNPLSYKGYGCYCGFLGSGYVVDGIDRCCKLHDWCYDTAGCPMFLEYFIPYMWQCYNHHFPICAIDHGEFGGPGSCAQKLCECDRELAQCLKMYPCPRNKALCTSSPWRLLQNLLMN